MHQGFCATRSEMLLVPTVVPKGKRIDAYSADVWPAVWLLFAKMAGFFGTRLPTTLAHLYNQLAHTSWLVAHTSWLAEDVESSSCSTSCSTWESPGCCGFHTLSKIFTSLALCCKNRRLNTTRTRICELGMLVSVQVVITVATA